MLTREQIEEYANGFARHSEGSIIILELLKTIDEKDKIIAGYEKLCKELK